MGRKNAIITMTTLQGVMMILFYFIGGTEAGLYIGATIIGFNFGGNFALFPAATADFFGNKNVGTNYPWVFLAYGIAGIEFIVDERDGIPKLLEINPRPYGPIQLAVSSGVDFPHLLYRMAVEGDVEKDFIHISYLATDEFLEAMPILIPEGVGQFRENLVFNPIDHDVDLDLSEEGAEKFGPG
jgi:hypothetical protein